MPKIPHGGARVEPDAAPLVGMGAVVGAAAPNSYAPMSQAVPATSGRRNPR